MNKALNRVRCVFTIFSPRVLISINKQYGFYRKSEIIFLTKTFYSLIFVKYFFSNQNKAPNKMKFRWESLFYSAMDRKNMPFGNCWPQRSVIDRRSEISTNRVQCSLVSISDMVWKKERYFNWKRERNAFCTTWRFEKKKSQDVCKA